jgi:hypothetical protein
MSHKLLIVMDLYFLLQWVVLYVVKYVFSSLFNHFALSLSSRDLLLDHYTLRLLYCASLYCFALLAFAVEKSNKS